MTTYTVEVCVDCIESIHSALRAGADRIELCSALSEGGLTPSMAFIRQAIRIAPTGSVYVMIRPRMGDFLYTTDEKELMLEDIALIKDLGVGGIVIGALQADGTLDLDFLRQVKTLVGSEVDLTFHRAFDVCRDREEALKQLIDLGYKRILTSGGATNAEQGALALEQLNRLAQGRIRLIVAGGVSPNNIEILRDTTKAVEYHLSAKMQQDSLMQYRNTTVSMGRSEDDEYSRYVVSEAILGSLIRKLKGY